jgi:hypothetical protein
MCGDARRRLGRGLTNGMSAVRRGDLATAGRWRNGSRRRFRLSKSESGSAHAGHGGAPPSPSKRISRRRSCNEMAASSPAREEDEAVELLPEGGQPRSNASPNGAADPVKPSHEVLGSAPRPAIHRAAKVFEACSADATAHGRCWARRAHAAAGDAPRPRAVQKARRDLGATRAAGYKRPSGISVDGRRGAAEQLLTLVA